MRKRVAIAGTALAAVAATGVTVNAAQAGQDGNSQDAASVDTQAVRRITVVERAVSDDFVDIGPSGDSRGDLIAFANPVYDRTNSTRVGRDQGSCIRTAVGRSWQCSWTTRLAKGSLVVEGPFYDKRDSVLAITGGTGAYTRARGVMRLHARNATSYTFRFVVRN